MEKSVTKRHQNLWKVPQVNSGQQLECRIGTLELTIAHGVGEWMLFSRSIAEEEADAQVRFDLGEGVPEAVQERFVQVGESGRVILAPLLADRPIVVRPRQPVFLLSGQTTTLYLSTPIWLQILVGDPAVLLKELPVIVPSDTWFGPSTREGELCYAGRTQARHDPAELPDRPHRAITPLTIHNKASTPLPLEKVSLPVPMLALYADQDGRLWTQKLTLTRHEQGDLASIQIESSKTDGDSSLTRLAEPRIDSERSGMTRAFNLLFGDGS